MHNRCHGIILFFAVLPLLAAIAITSACRPDSGAVMVSAPDMTPSLAGDGTAKNNMKTCDSVEVRLTGVTTEFYKQGVSFDDPPKINVAPRVTGLPVTVTALGPVLGSMDSKSVKTELACTPKGVVLTATLTRSADYHAASAKNVLWRPRIEAEIVPRGPEVTLEVTWRIRLTTGEELDHAQTPPYPDTKYPLTVTETIR